VNTLKCVWYTERNFGVNAEILHSMKTDVEKRLEIEKLYFQ